MTVPVIKIKVLPKPALKGKMDVRFPARVGTEDFLTVGRANGTYTFGADYAKLQTWPISDQTKSLVAVYDEVASSFKYNTVAEIVSATDASVAAVEAELNAHEARTDNPHAVTKAQVGLGNVDNTSDATKNAAVATLTNKTISGASNTITNIPIGSLNYGTAQVVSAASGTVNNGASLVAVQRSAPAATTLTLPTLASQGGVPLKIVDWSTSVTSHQITLTPTGGATIMKQSSWSLFSSADQLGSLALYPSTDLNAWIIA